MQRLPQNDYHILVIGLEVVLQPLSSFYQNGVAQSFIFFTDYHKYFLINFKISNLTDNTFLTPIRLIFARKNYVTWNVLAKPCTLLSGYSQVLNLTSFACKYLIEYLHHCLVTNLCSSRGHYNMHSAMEFPGSCHKCQ